MKVSEMKEIVKALYEELYWEYDCIGIRFENKVRTEGEVIEDCSRNNRWDEDNRDFPVYGSEAYDTYEVMDGISTWSLMAGQEFSDRQNGWLWKNPDKDAYMEFMGEHAYIIVGNNCGYEQINGLIDGGELLIADPVVAKVLY